MFVSCSIWSFAKLYKKFLQRQRQSVCVSKRELEYKEKTESRNGRKNSVPVFVLMKRFWDISAESAKSNDFVELSD